MGGRRVKASPPDDDVDALTLAFALNQLIALRPGSIVSHFDPFQSLPLLIISALVA